jgi:glycosyltransferase involved in cell wall biosynthesis
MHIVMSCIVPLFPDYDLGGAQKHLRYIARHLGDLGHDVTILSTRRADTPAVFHWHKRVQVKALYRFKQPFPQPYAIPAFDMAAAIQDLGEHLQHADRFYMHDGEFLFPFVYADVPTVISPRDNVYPETLLGSFLFNGYRMVVISQYARQYFEQTAGRFFPDLAERIVVIPNGIDWDYFRPTPPEKILDLIPVNPAEDNIVLHPHRPEETKGIWQTIGVVEQLVQQYQIPNIKTLVPRWLGLENDPELQKFYQRVEEMIAQKNLQDHFIFHDWIPYELLPAYYSLGHVSFSLGSFVESFGNAVYESLGCGTPAVVARISSHREILPQHLVDKVDFNDINTAARLAAGIIREKRPTSEATLRYLHEHYSLEKQLAAYAEVILNAQKPEPLTYQLHPIGDDTRFRLAPWCYEANRARIYHDFRADFQHLPALVDLLSEDEASFTFDDARNKGISRDMVMDWYRASYVVPHSPGSH